MGFGVGAATELTWADIVPKRDAVISSRHYGHHSEKRR